MSVEVRGTARRDSAELRVSRNGMASLVPFSSVLGYVAGWCSVIQSGNGGWVSPLLRVLATSFLRLDLHGMAFRGPCSSMVRESLNSSHATPLGEATRVGLVLQCSGVGRSWPSFLGCLASAMYSWNFARNSFRSTLHFQEAHRPMWLVPLSLKCPTSLFQSK